MLDPQLWVGNWRLLDFSTANPRDWGTLTITYLPPIQGEKGIYMPAGGLSGFFSSSSPSLDDRPLKNIWSFSAPPSPGRPILSFETETWEADRMSLSVVVLCLHVSRLKYHDGTIEVDPDHFWGSYIYKKPDGHVYYDPWYGTRYR